MSVHINDPDFFKFVEQATSDSRVSFIHIMPVLIRIFPVCLAYADGLLFVGMLNAANSPLNETVVYLFYYITLCRILQCVSAYLMFDVFEEGSGSDQAHQTTPFAATTLASVFAFVLAAYHFSSCVVYSAALNYIGVLGPIYSLQLSFIILMSCLELSKFILSCALFFSDDNIMETVFKQRRMYCGAGAFFSSTGCSAASHGFHHQCNICLSKRSGQSKQLSFQLFGTEYDVMCNQSGSWFGRGLGANGVSFKLAASYERPSSGSALLPRKSLVNWLLSNFSNTISLQCIRPKEFKILDYPDFIFEIVSNLWMSEKHTTNFHDSCTKGIPT